MKLSNNVYDVAKWIAQIFLPAFTVFLGVLLSSFHVDNAEVIITVMTAFDTFLGAILGLSTASYNKKLEAKKEVKEEST